MIIVFIENDKIWYQIYGNEAYLVYDYFDRSENIVISVRKICKNYDITLSGNTSDIKQHLRYDHVNAYKELMSKAYWPTLSLHSAVTN